jgi:hypothetical protein
MDNGRAGYEAGPSSFFPRGLRLIPPPAGNSVRTKTKILRGCGLSTRTPLDQAKTGRMLGGININNRDGSLVRYSRVKKGKDTVEKKGRVSRSRTGPGGRRTEASGGVARCAWNTPERIRHHNKFEEVSCYKACAVCHETVILAEASNQVPVDNHLQSWKINTGGISF